MNWKLIDEDATLTTDRPSKAQERVITFLSRVRERDAERGGKHAADPGWIQFWEIAQECGSTVPLGLLPGSFSKTIDALVKRGLIEQDQRFGELFRVRVIPISDQRFEEMLRVPAAEA